jgi:hypothetical protein
MIYTDKNLVKYEDTIQLHFDARGKTAWLTLKNYEFAFGMLPRRVPSPRNLKIPHLAATVTVTVGVPATESGKLPSAPDDLLFIQKLGFNEGEFKPYHKTISIGGMLDAIDVIKLQVEILTATSKITSPKVFTLRSLIETILDALRRLFPLRKFHMRNTENDRDFFEATLESFRKDRFGSPPGALAIWDEILAYRPEVNKDTVGFTAYFPDARLIEQEERTLMMEGGEGAKGKTQNTDTRAIALIPSGMPNPTKVPVGEGMKQPQWEFQWIVDELDIPVKTENLEKSGKEVKNEGAGNLHLQIERVSCFGFRGDDRDPQQMKKAGGFLPGVTRNDPRYIGKFGNRARDIDETLPYRPRDRADKPDNPFRRVHYERADRGTPSPTKELSPELKKYLEARISRGMSLRQNPQRSPNISPISGEMRST